MTDGTAVQANEESRLPPRLFAIIVQCRLAGLTPQVRPATPQAFRNKLLGPSGYIALGELGKLKVVVHSGRDGGGRPTTTRVDMEPDVPNTWRALGKIGIAVPPEYETK